MSQLLNQWPAPLQKAVVEELTRRGLSESDWLAEAASEKIQAESELSYVRSRAVRGNQEAYIAALDAVPDTTPMLGDELPAPQ